MQKSVIFGTIHPLSTAYAHYHCVMLSYFYVNIIPDPSVTDYQDTKLCHGVKFT